MKNYKWIDPPSGWKFGFPMALPEGFELTDGNIAKFLLDNGYPIEDIPLALKYSRFGF